jgi:phytoene synthase
MPPMTNSDRIHAEEPADESGASDDGNGAQAELRALMAGGSKTFFAASLLLPGRVRAPATALYAFCRLADDAIDFGTDKDAAARELRRRLDAIYRGRPEPVPADRALAPVVRRFGIPRALLDGLLEGFVWDAQERRYETQADLQGYGARVAGTVGAMMALIMDTRSPAALARACELGVAMQFTNIARDVGEDARAGRLYLPLQWLREAGVDPDAWLREPVFDGAIASVIERLLGAADELYLRSQAGIGALPRDCRPAIRAAQLVYAEIGQQVRRQGLDSVNHRAVVARRRKAALIARAAAAWVAPPPRGATEPPALPAVQFLVDAAQADPGASGPGASRAPPRSVVPRRSFEEKAVWATDLFARLASNDHRVSR